jgi:hypothetical protein
MVAGGERADHADARGRKGRLRRPLPKFAGADGYGIVISSGGKCNPGGSFTEQQKGSGLQQALGQELPAGDRDRSRQHVGWSGDLHDDPGRYDF